MSVIDLFGLKGHEEQHETAERVLRRLVEQVGQLSIDLGQTRMELRRLALVVDGKIEAEAVDPLFATTNKTLEGSTGRAGCCCRPKVGRSQRGVRRRGRSRARPS